MAEFGFKKGRSSISQDQAAPIRNPVEPVVLRVPKPPVAVPTPPQARTPGAALLQGGAFWSTAQPLQRAVVTPVFEAANLRQAYIVQRQAEHAGLQRQVEALSAQLPARAVALALQRQRAAQQPPALPAAFTRPGLHPQPNDCAGLFHYEVGRLQPYPDGSYPAAPVKAIQERAVGTLVRSAGSSRLPALQRQAEVGQALADITQHPLGRLVAHHALHRLPAAEQPVIRRAMDEALQRRAEQDRHDQQALELHALQRQLDDAGRPHGEAEVMRGIQTQRGAGDPLPAAVQRHLEQGLNADLSKVRIHTGAEADRLSKSVGARAFTAGQDIFFQRGAYQPNSHSGLELLAHETTHTVQQAQGQAKPGVDADAGLEAEARRMGERLAADGRPARKTSRVGQSVRATSGVVIQRQSAPAAPGSDPPQTWQRGYVGDVGHAHITMDLHRNGTTLSGSYQYGGHDGRLTLHGTVLSSLNVVELHEYDASGRETGVIRGGLYEDAHGSQLRGVWSSPDGRRNLNIQVSVQRGTSAPAQPSGPARAAQSGTTPAPTRPTAMPAPNRPAQPPARSQGPVPGRPQPGPGTQPAAPRPGPPAPQPAHPQAAPAAPDPAQQHPAAPQAPGAATRPHGRNVVVTQGTDAQMQAPNPIPLAGLTGVQRQMAQVYNARGSYLDSVAPQLGIDPAVVVAVMSVESGSAASSTNYASFRGRNMTVRFENHLFHDSWGRQHPQEFAQHFRFDVHRSSRGGLDRTRGHQFRTDPQGAWQSNHASQRSEWQVLDYARGLSDGQAIGATSMGVGQILGSNYRSQGYRSPQEMLTDFSSGLRPQLDGVLTYIRQHSMGPLQRGDFFRFAQSYNGAGDPALARRYAQRIEQRVAAYRQLMQQHRPAPPAPHH